MNYESGRGKEPLKMYLLGENKEKENSVPRRWGWSLSKSPVTLVHTAPGTATQCWVGWGATLLIIFLGWHYQETHDKHFIIDIWWLKRILTLVIIIYFFSAFNIFKEYSMTCGKQRVGINTSHVISKLSLQTGDVFSDIALPAFFLKKKTISSYSHFI